MKFPNTVDQNTFKAYIGGTGSQTIETISCAINTFSSNWDKPYPEQLSILCIRSIANNWCNCPIFSQIEGIENKRNLLDILDVDLPLSDLAVNIDADIFWRRCFQSRWKQFYPHSIEQRPWISLYIERFLAEWLESVKPMNWNEEETLQIIRVCSPHVICLCIEQLQPSMDERNEHIRIDYVLRNLFELRSLQLTYSVKCIATDYILGCSKLSSNDIKWLSEGLETCNKIVEFRLVNIVYIFFILNDF